MKYSLIILVAICLGSTTYSQEAYPESTGENEEIEVADPAQQVIRYEEQVQGQHRRHHRRNQTIFGNRHGHSGGYGALSIHLGEMNDQDAIIVGGRGAWVIGSGFGMGFGIYGLANDVIYDDIIPEQDLQLEMGYGGLLLEPIIAPWLPVHLSFPTLIGMGGAIYTDDSFRYNDRFDWDLNVIDDDLFFVFEPGAYIELHLVRFFRLGIGAQYRFLGDLDLLNTGKQAFDGWTGGVTLKFGVY